MHTKREENYEEKLGNLSELQKQQQGSIDRCILKFEESQSSSSQHTQQQQDDNISEYSLNFNHIAQQLCSLGNNNFISNNPLDIYQEYQPQQQQQLSSSNSSSNLLSRYFDHQQSLSNNDSQQQQQLFETDLQQPDILIRDHKDDDEIFDMFIEDAYQKQENQDDQSVFGDQQLNEKLQTQNNSLFTRNFDTEGFLPFNNKTFTMKSVESYKEQQVQEEQTQQQQSQKIDVENINNNSNEQLEPFEEEDFNEPELCFELPDFGGDEEAKNNQLQSKNGKKPIEIWKVTQKISSEKKKKEYDKNICRYISRCIVRCFVHQNYNKKIYAMALDILQKESKEVILAKFDSIENQESINFEVLKYELYNLAKEYMLGEIENLTGHRALQDILCYNDESLYLEKKLFRTFSKWFLKERATRYILDGNMKNKGSYINYKNKVMLYYIEKPEQWISNHVRVRKR